ncbi:MAG: DUF2764 family protein [Candidatus Neomarinimicrobiota bacterium]
MDKYIYFAASMPTLRWGAEQQYMTEKDFLEEAEKLMSETDFQHIKNTLVNDYEPKEIKGVYSDFLTFENRLRTELAEYRKATKEGFEYKFSLLPAQLLKDANPLEIELKLIKFRWDWLEEREFSHYSDLDFFVLYYLKLQLLKRMNSFKQEIGEKAFEELIKVNIENTEEASE